MAAIRPIDADLVDAIVEECSVPSETWTLPDSGIIPATRAPGPTTANALLSAGRVRALKSLESREDAKWFAVGLRLRCWIRMREDSVAPVIPLVIVIASVVPSGPGRLLVARLCDPPDQAPTTQAAVDALFGAAAAEAPPGDVRYVPGSVVFADADLAARCAPVLALAGIKTAVTSSTAPPGLALLRDELSRRLVQAKLGLISPASLQPGLVQPGGSVTPHLQRAFLRLAAVFSARQPWTRISERQTFRLRLPTPGGGGGSDVAWVSVIGEQSLRARAEVARLVAEGRVGVALPPVVRGLSVFFKRFDVERRDADILASPSVKNPCDLECAAPGCGQRRPDLHNCSSCREVFYCNAECQKAHWKAGHEAACKARAVAKGLRVATGGANVGTRAYWGEREAVLLFENAVATPLEDVDAAEAAGAEPSTPVDYPNPAVFRRGAYSRPNRDELAWLLRAMSAVLRILAVHPADAAVLVPMAAERRLDLAEPPVFRPGGAAGGHWLDVLDDEEPSVFFRTDPILSKEERARILEAMQQQERAGAAQQQQMEGGAAEEEVPEGTG